MFQMPPYPANLAALSTDTCYLFECMWSGFIQTKRAVRLLPKCNALQCLERDLSIEWMNTMFKCDILRSIFRAAPWSKRWKKQQWNAAEFLGSILHNAQFIFNALSSGSNKY